jgi:sugar (pentulose or hexulose) kinase
MNLYLGLDFGTSGARAILIDSKAQVHAAAKRSYNIESVETWQSTLFDLIERIPAELRVSISAIAIAATSGTILICDSFGQPVSQPLLYHDARGSVVLSKLSSFAPEGHIVIGATSSLAKLVWWYEQHLNRLGDNVSLYLQHQADRIGFLLHGELGVSDYHNALKLGYDILELRYPDWLIDWQSYIQLPRVLTPGVPIAPIKPELAAKWGLSPTCSICAGTTDSTAAFLASVGTDADPGQAVTSLGSTLVLKVLSQERVEDARYGIYSHRLGDRWLVGGASNTGGNALSQFFSDRELVQLSEQINPDWPSQLDYYPLSKPGERFPVSDPQKLPRLQPRPENPVEFLHGLLESIARIEAEGYRLLQSLGTSPVHSVCSIGGGASNQTWERIRSRYLQVPLMTAKHSEAAYGAALLAVQNAQTEPSD